MTTGYKFRIGDLLIAAGVVVFFLAGVRFEFFDAFYEFSRNHEDWELDEISSLLFGMVIAAPIYLYRANRRLREANRDLAQARETAHFNARVDPLTGLWNRRHLIEVLEGEPPGSAAAILLIDLDRFKPINDLRGHAAGDRLLIVLAGRLKAMARGRAEVFRLGGDEFAVVYDESGGRSAEDLARDISDVIAQPVEIDAWWAECGCSIGVSHWEAGMDAMRLLREADQAMYAAKQAGRGRVVSFDFGMGEDARRRAELEDAFKAGVAQGNFVPFYQPYFDIRSGGIGGVELLARWNDPVHSAVPASEFIRIAEETGLIDRLTDQLLDRACRDMAAWPRDLRVSLNLSPSQFCDEGLPARVLGILDTHGIAPNRLEIEITESAVFADQDMARAIIGALVSEGVGITLDDFGTGTSSLTMLAQMPFSKLKIDRSFVTGVEASEQGGKIVSSVLSLARTLGMDVTAEGVERVEELNFLRSQDCHYGQGFLLSHPVPAERITALIADPESEMDKAG